jgi:hypothetical protein
LSTQPDAGCAMAGVNAASFARGWQVGELGGSNT